MHTEGFNKQIGWVEVDDDRNITYEYNGDDPNDRVVPFLEEAADGNINLYASTEHSMLMQPNQILAKIEAKITGKGDIAFCLLHNDYEEP